MNKQLFLLIFMLIALFSCNNKDTENNCCNKDSIKLSETEQLVMSVVWYQKSAEMQACYYQAYNLAKLALDKNLSEYKGSNKKSVVVDVDETVLDNSPYEVKIIETGIPFSLEGWKTWSSLKKAKALPGALEFLKYAESKGVEVFYISNRELDEVESTKLNLINEGFPFVDDVHLLFKSDNSDKTIRRSKVSEEYEILLLVGDNLRDFDEIFKEREINLGFDNVAKNKDLFGTKYIMLPNPMYGEWEKAVYGGKYPETTEEIIKLRKEILKSEY